MSAARRTTVLAAALLVAAALSGPVFAEEALFLTWNDCASGPAATHDLLSDCASSAGEQELVCSFRVGAAVDSVLGLEVVVDLQHAQMTLPDWWRVEVGGCRPEALTTRFDFPLGSCADLFDGQAAGGLLDFVVGRPRGSASQAEIRAAASLLPGYGYATLDPALTYYAATLRITNLRTIGTTACTGCLGAACLVLNSVRVLRQPGAVGGDVLLTNPGAGNANWASWQGGSGADCMAVPVRSVTWGQVKGLYR